MSLMLKEVADYLESISIPSSGAKIRTDFIPETPDAVNVIFSYGGASPELGFGVPGLQFETPGLQVRTRGLANDSDEPELRIQKIYQALPKVQASTISLTGPKYHHFLPQQAPFIMERDGKNRVVWVVNFLVKKVPHTV